MTEPLKKRKWDQDDHHQSSPATKINRVVDDKVGDADKKNDQQNEIDPSKAVSEAAARINAMLAQKGIPIDEKVATKPDGEFAKDITINDLKNRYMLTRGATQAQIQQETGADVITRGKYYPDVSLATEKEPPLYLHITASTKESLDKAVEKIEELIETIQVPTLATGIFNKEDKHETHKRPERKFFEKRLPVEVHGTPHFNLRAKIVGPNGAFVKHIQQETGCRVQLKGKGSGFYESSTGVESDEPLHVHISCIREEGLEAGIKLTQDLLDTVKAEAERGPPQNHYGYGRGGYNPARGGYNGYGSPYSGYHQSPSAATANSTPNSDASSSTPGGYDYEAYNNYYSSYYGQPPVAGQEYQQYDPNSYYNYYGYSLPTDSTATPPPPPPSASTDGSATAAAGTTVGTSAPPPPPPPSSAAAPPPPPPPSSATPPPPPPPPSN